MSDRGGASCDIVILDDVETLDSSSSEALVALAAADATGELVCSCPQGDAHVYLQRGRVAWANDCKHRRAFTTHLQEQAGVAESAIDEVVTECRSTRRPIGETLIARGLASEAQVRAALRHQIHLALHIGQCRGEAQPTFQPRDYPEYDERFTFDVEELLTEERQR